MNYPSSIDTEPPLQTTVHETMSSPISPPKRPRLSLQIKAPAVPQALGKSITALKTDFTDPFSPTAFNTLSNAYAAAIESCSPCTSKPVQAPKPTISVPPSRPKLLRLQTSSSDDLFSISSQRMHTPGPFTNLYPDSPSTSISPTSKGSNTNSAFPFTFTPPQSAHPQEATDSKIFTFASSHLSSNMSPISPNSNALRRRNTIAGLHSAPYTHPRSLRSILRNSPLPPRSNLTPASPRRMSLRYNPNKKVGYNTPLTQTITTTEYTHSHIDLLSEEASPFTPTDIEKEGILETSLAYTGDETKDGGQTPGPYEEMRRRMASLGDETSTSSSGLKKKRKRREKKRQWIWTIGDNEDDEVMNDCEDRVDSPVLPVGSGSCSVPLPLPPATALSSRESSISSASDPDSDMGREEFVGSPHSV